VVCVSASRGRPRGRARRPNYGGYPRKVSLGAPSLRGPRWQELRTDHAVAREAVGGSMCWSAWSPRAVPAEIFGLSPGGCAL